MKKLLCLIIVISFAIPSFSQDDDGVKTLDLSVDHSLQTSRRLVQNETYHLRRYQRQTAFGWGLMSLGGGMLAASMFLTETELKKIEDSPYYSNPKNYKNLNYIGIGLLTVGALINLDATIHLKNLTLSPLGVGLTVKL